MKLKILLVWVLFAMVNILYADEIEDVVHDMLNPPNPSKSSITDINKNDLDMMSMVENRRNDPEGPMVLKYKNGKKAQEIYNKRGSLKLRMYNKKGILVYEMMKNSKEPDVAKMEFYQSDGSKKMSIQMKSEIFRDMDTMNNRNITSFEKLNLDLTTNVKYYTKNSQLLYTLDMNKIKNKFKGTRKNYLNGIFSNYIEAEGNIEPIGKPDQITKLRGEMIGKVFSATGKSKGHFTYKGTSLEGIINMYDQHGNYKGKRNYNFKEFSKKINPD